MQILYIEIIQALACCAEKITKHSRILMIIKWQGNYVKNTGTQSIRISSSRHWSRLNNGQEEIPDNLVTRHMKKYGEITG